MHRPPWSITSLSSRPPEAFWLFRATDHTRNFACVGPCWSCEPISSVFLFLGFGNVWNPFQLLVTALKFVGASPNHWVFRPSSFPCRAVGLHRAMQFLQQSLSSAALRASSHVGPNRRRSSRMVFGQFFLSSTSLMFDYNHYHLSMEWHGGRLVKVVGLVKARVRDRLRPRQLLHIYRDLEPGAETVPPVPPRSPPMSWTYSLSLLWRTIICSAGLLHLNNRAMCTSQLCVKRKENGRYKRHAVVGLLYWIMGSSHCAWVSNT